MQDTYVEYMVRRKTTATDMVRKVLYFLAGLIVLFLCFLFSGSIGILGMLLVLVGMAAVAGAFWLISRLNVEYEYTLTNGEMDVDAIYSKKSRKRLLNFHCKDVEFLSPYTGGKKQGYETVVSACSHPGDPNVWCCGFKAGGRGKTMLIFSTSDTFLAAMKPFLPGLVAREAFAKQTPAEERR